MNLRSIRAFAFGAALAAIAPLAAAPITGAQDPSSVISLINQYLLNWMSFPAAEYGELQLLGAHSFVVSGSNHYVVFVDQGGTPRYVLTTSSTTP